jgi:hypothetical protein
VDYININLSLPPMFSPTRVDRSGFARKTRDLYDARIFAVGAGVARSPVHEPVSKRAIGRFAGSSPSARIPASPPTFLGISNRSSRLPSRCLTVASRARISPRRTCINSAEIRLAIEMRLFPAAPPKTTRASRVVRRRKLVRETSAPVGATSTTAGNTPTKTRPYQQTDSRR